MNRPLAVAGVAVAAVAATVIPAMMASPADAHTPNITASCSGVRILATQYQTNQTNRWSVTIAGVTTSGTFGASFDQTFPVPQGGATTAWAASIDVLESNQYDQYRSGNVGPCGTATPTPTPTPTPSVPTEPPTTATPTPEPPPPTVPPTVPPTEPPAVKYKPRHDIWGNCSEGHAWLLNKASNVRARAVVTILRHGNAPKRTIILKAKAGQNVHRVFGVQPGQWFSIHTKGVKPVGGHARTDCGGSPGGS